MYNVIKAHRVSSGSTTSAVKAETYEQALQQYHQLASNYMADTSVLAWSLSIVKCDPGEDMKMLKRESYARPDPEEQADE